MFYIFVLTLALISIESLAGQGSQYVGMLKQQKDGWDDTTTSALSQTSALSLYETNWKDQHVSLRT